MNQKGFTLIELLAVVLIIGIIATVGILMTHTAVENSKNVFEKTTINYEKIYEDK